LWIMSKLRFQILNEQIGEYHHPYPRQSIRIFPKSEKDEICRVEIRKRSARRHINERSRTLSRVGMTDKPFCERSRITRLCQECRVGSFAVATYIPEYGITPEEVRSPLISGNFEFSEDPPLFRNSRESSSR